MVGNKWRRDTVSPFRRTGPATSSSIRWTRTITTACSNLGTVVNHESQFSLPREEGRVFRIECLMFEDERAGLMSNIPYGLDVIDDRSSPLGLTGR